MALQEVFETRPYPRQSKSQARAARRAGKISKNGHHDAPLTSKTRTQREYIERLRRGESVFAVGPAGTGKTYIPARIAARMLAERKIDKIVICRVTVSDPRHALGFLPGRLDQKLAPWLVPVFDAIKSEVSTATLDKWKQEGLIEAASFEHLRGRSFHDCFVLLDEAQNATLADLKLMLTRIGENCQVVVTGDLDQIDIHNSGLYRVMRLAEEHNVPMSVVFFSDQEVVRSTFCRAWVAAFATNIDTTVRNLDQPPSFLHNARSGV